MLPILLVATLIAIIALYYFGIASTSIFAWLLLLWCIVVIALFREARPKRRKPKEKP